MDGGDNFDTWFRWGVGLFLALLSGLIGYLNRKIDGIQSSVPREYSTDLRDVWTEVAKLREAIEKDRQNSADARVALASSIVTRDELDRQVNRWIESTNGAIRELIHRGPRQ